MRSVERFADETRDLRLVREVETRRDAGLERKLSNQRQAERIDGRDGNVGQSLPQFFPS